MVQFSACVAFYKATDGQTGVKHDKAETRFSSMSLLMDRVEMLPPSRRSSLEMVIVMVMVNGNSNILVWQKRL